MIVESKETRESTEESLVERARRGEHRVFESLVARHEGSVYRLALRMSGNEADAEEITQETFLHAHRGLSSFKGNARFGTWLYRIALNEALVRRRSSRRRPLELHDTLSPQFAKFELACAVATERLDDAIQSRTLAARVRAALAELDEASRAALVLRDLEQMSAEEAGTVLGVSAEVVRKRAHRARMKLRERLAGIQGEWR
jgi:RNA polymerase sigma-70 factor (ECF subfamily)